MLDLNYIRNNLDTVKDKCRGKGVEFDEKKFLDIDARRREWITQSEQLKSRKNSLAKEIGQLKRDGKESGGLQQQTIELSRQIGGIEKKLAEVESQFQDFILNIPNMFHDSVPVGKDETDNVETRVSGKKPLFSFKPRPHWELGEKNGLLDLPRATKISGARFALYRGRLAKLERVLMHFMLDAHTTENGYTEILPPFLVNDQSLIGTGNLPKFKDDLFKIAGYNLYLIPTAEVPLTNIHRDETLDGPSLPLNYVAGTPCFRSEAGSHGKDIRGIIRQHQFNKVELLKFTRPERSYDELEKLTGDAEKILQKLGLHYRVVTLCSGDLSFSSAKTYDIEVWMPEREKFVEISSCSNFQDFQARRSRIKYKNDLGKKEFVHTLNGSGLAVGRTVAAIMENFQLENGDIAIPECLRDFFPGQTVL